MPSAQYSLSGVEDIGAVPMRGSGRECGSLDAEIGHRSDAASSPTNRGAVGNGAVEFSHWYFAWSPSRPQQFTWEAHKHGAKLTDHGP